ncbi:MAG: DUF2589 domain-containing protein [Colwellia sp.]
MIRFQALMHSIQESIHSAAEAVESAGDKHLKKFFDKILNEHYQDKVDEIKEAKKEGDNERVKELRKEMVNLPTGEDDSTEGVFIYRPKMVAMAFPSQGVNGVESTIVNVPKITLSPISSPRIKDVKFTADLEVTTEENDGKEGHEELKVAFRAPQVSGGENIVTKDSTNTHIEICLVGHEPPEGLQKIIEGYEKALRAQIPG